MKLVLGRCWIAAMANFVNVSKLLVSDDPHCLIPGPGHSLDQEDMWQPSHQQHLDTHREEPLSISWWWDLKVSATIRIEFDKFYKFYSQKSTVKMNVSLLEMLPLHCLGLVPNVD